MERAPAYGDSLTFKGGIVLARNRGGAFSSLVRDSELILRSESYILTSYTGNHSNLIGGICSLGTNTILLESLDITKSSRGYETVNISYYLLGD
jgi:hypothetical protein